MDLVRVGDVEVPELPIEVVPVPALKGSVKVRSLTLTERLDMEERVQKIKRELAKASRESGKVGAMAAAAAKKKADFDGIEMVPDVLAICVIDADDKPLFTAAGWQKFGGKNLPVAISLFNTAWRLSGMALVDPDEPQPAAPTSAADDDGGGGAPKN